MSGAGPTLFGHLMLDEHEVVYVSGGKAKAFPKWMMLTREKFIPYIRYHLNKDQACAEHWWNGAVKVNDMLGRECVWVAEETVITFQRLPPLPVWTVPKASTQGTPGRVVQTPAGGPSMITESIAGTVPGSPMSIGSNQGWRTPAEETVAHSTAEHSGGQLGGHLFNPMAHPSDSN